MEDRVRERMRDEHVAHDTRLLGDFARIYCNRKHPDREKRRLESAGVEAGVYRKPPVVCPVCGAEVRSQRALWTHRRTVHPGARGPTPSETPAIRAGKHPDGGSKAPRTR